jgi:hypothetical protein
MPQFHRMSRRAAATLAAVFAPIVLADYAGARAQEPTARACEPDTTRVERARAELANELSRVGATWNGAHSRPFNPKLLHPVRDERSCAAVRDRLASAAGKHVIVLEFEGFLFARPSGASHWQVLTSKLRVLTPGSRPVDGAPARSAD